MEKYPSEPRRIRARAIRALADFGYKQFTGLFAKRVVPLLRNLSRVANKIGYKNLIIINNFGEIPKRPKGLPCSGSSTCKRSEGSNPSFSAKENGHHMVSIFLVVISFARGI